MITRKGTNNSLEVYTSLFTHLYRDIADCYPECTEHDRDLMKISSRIESEGISFLTKSLPRLGKAFDKALQGSEPLVSEGFSKLPGTVIPKLFGWLLGRVFSADGYVRSDADITAIKQARQLFTAMYKLELPYEPATEKSVADSFIQVEEEIKNLNFDLKDPVIKRARTIISRVFAGVDHRDIVPRHGPGAVATGERVGEKSDFSRIYSRLEKEYPFTEYFMLGLNHVIDQLDWIESLESKERATAKVVFVPKDSRGPRLISCEPLELQWIQQGLQRLIYPHVERHPLTKRHVNFTNQEINRRLALEGSRTRKYVTLDMKDASDRVSLRLVETLFSGTSLLKGLMASRSDETRLPDGRVVSLAKFAPMGSAVCFPIEALCFWALSVSLLRGSGRSWHYAFQNVWVFGDDIIVRRQDYPLLMQWFPKFGLKFNTGKCCTQGFFRESCGCDAYKGIDVTPVKLRRVWGHRGTRSADELVSYVSFHNEMYSRGYWSTCSYLRSLIGGRYGNLPYIQDECKSVIGFTCSHVQHHVENKKKRVRVRMNPHLHILEYRTWITTPLKEEFEVDGWREALRKITQGGLSVVDVTRAKDEPVVIPDDPCAVANVGAYALPRRSCLKRGWSPVTLVTGGVLP